MKKTRFACEWLNGFQKTEGNFVVWRVEQIQQKKTNLHTFSELLSCGFSKRFLCSLKKKYTSRMLNQRSESNLM